MVDPKQRNGDLDNNLLTEEKEEGVKFKSLLEGDNFEKAEEGEILNYEGEFLLTVTCFFCVLVPAMFYAKEDEKRRIFGSGLLNNLFSQITF